jgi:hypothetical protein
MKAIAATFVALFVLWVVDVNFAGGRYTDAIMRMMRPVAASIGIRN